MNALSRHIGRRIRQFRKMQGLTLQQMADQLKKSKATMSKYESGDIILDVETLYAIAGLLEISMSQLLDYLPEEEILPGNKKVSHDETFSEKPAPVNPGQSPFFSSDLLFFYYYDGRYRRLKTGTIHVHRGGLTEQEEVPASLVISSDTPMGSSQKQYYTGTVLYRDMLIRFDFINQQDSADRCQLSLFNPPSAPPADGPLSLQNTEELLSEGLLTGLTMPDQVPCAFKCLVSLSPQNTDLTGPLMPHLTFTRRELQLLQKRNMLLADNQFS